MVLSNERGWMEEERGRILNPKFAIYHRKSFKAFQRKRKVISFV